MITEDCFSDIDEAQIAYMVHVQSLGLKPEREKAISRFATMAGDELEVHLSTGSRTTRDVALLACTEASAAKNIPLIYQSGVSENAYQSALKIARAEMDKSQRYKKLATAAALVKQREPEVLLENAGPLARLLERQGKHRLAMIVADIGQGLERAEHKRTLAFAFLGPSVLVEVLGAVFKDGAGTPHAAGICVGLILGGHLLSDALTRGRSQRLEQALDRLTV